MKYQKHGPHREKHADLLKRNNEISEFQWEMYLKECTDIDIMSSSCTHKYLEIISGNIPSKMIQVRPSDMPWFNSHIKREIRTRNRSKKIARTKKSSTAIDKYKSHRNKVKNMIKHAREQFFLSANELLDSMDSFQRNDSKSYWSLIRKLMKGTSQNYSIPPLYDNDSNELIYVDKIKANLLNKYFVLFHLLMILIMFPQMYHQELMHYYLIYILLNTMLKIFYKH
jgi:hypothetical protein